MICECTSHLQRKEGDGHMQQILKPKFSSNYINRNARPLQTIQHKKQTLQPNHRNSVNNLKIFKTPSHLNISNNTNNSNHAHTFKHKKVATPHKFKKPKKQQQNAATTSQSSRNHHFTWKHLQGKHRKFEHNIGMRHTSRNCITKQPHNKHCNHQHHAAHATVICDATWNIAIQRAAVISASWASPSSYIQYCHKYNNNHDGKNHENTSFQAPQLPSKTWQMLQQQSRDKWRNNMRKIKSNSVRYDVKQLHKSIGTSSTILNHFHQQSSCKAYGVTCNIAIESMKHIWQRILHPNAATANTKTQTTAK